MKRHLFIPLAATLVWSSSCSKPQSDAERNVEIDRQVQQRLAAQQEQQAATQRAADLDAREKALAAKEAATPIPEAAATAEPQSAIRTTDERTTTERRGRVRENTESDRAGSYNTFYTQLERYGDWMETADYGYVFRPHDAENSRHWRPYTNGRWVHTEAGWTWVSEEPFGWATYHYGRWTRLENVGWVWVPGEQWAPAWVSWRTGDNYVGWAPLPPEAHFDRQTGIHNWSDNYYDIGPTQYAFVASVDLGSTNLERNVVPADQNVTIINRTTNITNITYNNTTVVNSGPNYDQYRGLSREPIQSLRLERRTSDNGPDAHTVIRGEVVEMPAPLIRANQAAERPRTLQQAVTSAVVDRGWSGLNDQNAVKQMRAKMNSEAAPPAGLPSKTFVKPAMAAQSAPTNPSAPAAPRPAQAIEPAPIPSLPPAATTPDSRARDAAVEQQKVAADQAAKSNAQHQMEEARKAKAAEQQSQIEAQRKVQQQQAETSAKADEARKAEAARATAAQSQAKAAEQNAHAEETAKAQAAKGEQERQAEAQGKMQGQQQAEAAKAQAAAAEKQPAAEQQKIQQQQQADAARKAAEARTREEKKPKPAAPQPAKLNPVPTAAAPVPAQPAPAASTPEKHKEKSDKKEKHDGEDKPVRADPATGAPVVPQ